MKIGNRFLFQRPVHKGTVHGIMERQGHGPFPLDFKNFLVLCNRQPLSLIQILQLAVHFLEEFADEAIADPDIGGADFRDRLAISIPASSRGSGTPGTRRRCWTA